MRLEIEFEERRERGDLTLTSLTAFLACLLSSRVGWQVSRDRFLKLGVE